MNKEKMKDIMGTIMGKAPTEEEKKKNPLNVRGAADTLSKRKKQMDDDMKRAMDEIGKS